MNRLQVVSLLSDMCHIYGSQKACAEAIGISPAYLSDVLNFRRDLGPKILNWLGLEIEITYVTKDEHFAGNP